MRLISMLSFCFLALTQSFSFGLGPQEPEAIIAPILMPIASASVLSPPPLSSTIGIAPALPSALPAATPSPTPVAMEPVSTQAAVLRCSDIYLQCQNLDNDECEEHASQYLADYYPSQNENLYEQISYSDGDSNFTCHDVFLGCASLHLYPSEEFNGCIHQYRAGHIDDPLSHVSITDPASP